ncbi:MAG: hypothetical protein AB2A00_43345 [Myxococcota bacterium]
MTSPESTPTPTPRQEAELMLRLARGDHLAALAIVERQFGVLVLRTQVLLSLCGIVITVTGFSGRAIAETSHLARYCISSGIVVVLLAAAVAILGVLRLRWLTQLMTADPVDALEQVIELRNRKARFLAVSSMLFIAGFGLYVGAIAQLLWSTQPR